MHLKKILLLIWLLSFNVFANEDAILGYWLVEAKDGIIKIYKENNKFYGKLVWIKDIADGKVKEPLDKENPDPQLQKRKLQNLQNLKDFVYTDGQWKGGTIYDPLSGKTYSAQMKIQGENLILRGYVGIPLFGRSETWRRVKEVPAYSK